MGEPVVFLPGMMCDARLFSHQFLALNADHAVMVAPLTGASTIGALAAQVLDAAPKRFALAGLSMGGYCAIAIARAAPERVTRLALLNTSARPDDPETLSRRRGLIELSTKGEFKGVTPLLLPLLLSEAGRTDPAIVETITAMAKRVGQPAFVRQQKAIMSRVDQRPHLADIAAPTLVVVGEDDALTPPDLAAELAGGLADAELLRIPRCGHLSTLERPDMVNPALRAWLARPPRTDA
ncbi:MAG: alpha/beta fold hydrolase [Pseudomonadota bacterium]